MGRVGTRSDLVAEERPAPGQAGIADVEAEARSVYDGRLFMARDFARYELDRQGQLAPVE